MLRAIYWFKIDQKDREYDELAVQVISFGYSLAGKGGVLYIFSRNWGGALYIFPVLCYSVGKASIQLYVQVTKEDT